MKQLFDICTKIAQTLLPQRCLLCSATSGNAPLCPACLDDLPRHAMPACPVCALPTPLGEVCGQCLRHPPAFDATHSAFTYDFPLDALLKALKYRGLLNVADIVATELSNTLQHQPPPDLLIPMPLHPQRLQERGFNQAVEICRKLARLNGYQLSLDSVIRVRHSEPQASLPLAQRAKNVKGVFAVTQDMAGKSVLVVDDIMTSGASLNELAKTLKQAGATRVECGLAARTLPHHV
jgi:ComF family protein